MTMKTEPIPVIAVFKNGIVNVNKAVAVKDGMVVRTYFIKEPKALDNARKGELVWKQ